LRIAVDVSPLSRRRTGVGQYLRGMTIAIADQLEEGDELCLAGVASSRGARAIRDALAGVSNELKVMEVVHPHAVRTAWSRIGWPPVERLVGRIDVFHASDWMQPRQRAGIRAATVCDLVPVSHPEWTTPRTRRMLRAKYADTAERCDVAFAISRFTALEAIDRLRLPEARVRVAYPGVDRCFVPDGEAERRSAPYVLAVGTVEPRKNLACLIAAFQMLRRSRPDVELVVAGPPGWGVQPDLGEEGVVALGYVDEQRLARLYRGAVALAYPSLLEGFGMPVVEGMASGVPVVASSHPSLDEAAGDAALRADPGSPEALADALAVAIDDPAPLRTAGLEHAAQFTWQACGQAVIEGYRSAVEGTL
jgi:glycosyltransferase involved in cell wall biosynthesis